MLYNSDIIQREERFVNRFRGKTKRIIAEKNARTEEH